MTTASPSELAERLNISNAAVTDMSKKLAEEGLVEYRKYKPVSLTPRGKKMALAILRKHRLWETFLYEVLKVPYETLHREAELLEHSTTDELTDRIDQFLGNPEYDPHGDPIPAKDGRMPTTKDFIALQDCSPGIYKIARLHLRTEELNKFFNELSIKAESEIEVLEQTPGMGTTVIQVNNEKLMVNKSIASHIYLKKKI